MDKQIIDNKFYTPKQIAENMFLFSFKGTITYFEILKLIKAGALVAFNSSKSTRPMYYVSGREIKRYNKKFLEEHDLFEGENEK